MVRAAVALEKKGFPTVALVCEGFVGQAQNTADGLGMPNLPLAMEPGHVNLKTKEELEKNTKTVTLEGVIKGLTMQPTEGKLRLEPNPKDIVFEGTFEEVNKFFYENQWQEGTPIVPPTVEKVTEFLKFTDQSPDEVIGVLLPDSRQATVWNIAVNGVMAGCRPEYMSVLIAIVEAMSDPKYGIEHSGNTPGSEELITVSGPIVKELDFNYTQGALRVGFQANTSIGRFPRLILRNIAGFLPHSTDKGTFGNTWRVVLAENYDAVRKIGWAPMSVDRGFNVDDNVITVARHHAGASQSSVSGGPDEILDNIADTLQRMVGIWAADKFTVGVGEGRNGCTEMPHVVMTPCIAEVLAKAGYSKKDVKRALYERARIPASHIEQDWKWQMRSPFLLNQTICDLVKAGKVPKQFCESTDPNRLIPIVCSPDDIVLTVSGDPLRNNVYTFVSNGPLGYTTSKKIKLPAKWQQLLFPLRFQDSTKQSPVGQLPVC